MFDRPCKDIGYSSRCRDGDAMGSQPNTCLTGGVNPHHQSAVRVLFSSDGGIASLLVLLQIVEAISIRIVRSPLIEVAEISTGGRSTVR
jgi:hypothetical protein